MRSLVIRDDVPYGGGEGLQSRCARKQGLPLAGREPLQRAHDRVKPSPRRLLHEHPSLRGSHKQDGASIALMGSTGHQPISACRCEPGRADDVKAAVERLRAAGVEVDTEPHQIFVDEDGIFGEAGVAEWMAFIHDSEGNLVGLASRQAASR